MIQKFIMITIKLCSSIHLTDAFIYNKYKDDGNGHSGITYTVNDKQCSESEYNEALQQLVQKISFTDINFETMGRSESPRDSIKGYHQAEK